MSVELMAQVWRHAPYNGARLLVLLSLADSASDEGCCWPSIGTIALKARLTERRVYIHLSALESDGWIRRESRPGHSNLYYVTTPDASVTPVASVTPDVVATPDASDRVPLTLASPTPDASDRVPLTLASPRTIIEPSVNHQRNRNRARATQYSENRSDGNLALAPVEPPDGAREPPPPPPPSSAGEGAILYERAPAFITWGRAKLRIQRQLSQAEMDSWINPLRLISLVRADGRFTLTMGAPGSAIIEQVTRRFGGLIATVYGECLGVESVDLHLVNVKG